MSGEKPTRVGCLQPTNRWEADLGVRERCVVVGCKQPTLRLLIWPLLLKLRTWKGFGRGHLNVYKLIPSGSRPWLYPTFNL